MAQFTDLHTQVNQMQEQSNVFKTMDPPHVGVQSSDSKYDTFGRFDQQVVNQTITDQVDRNEQVTH